MAGSDSRKATARRETVDAGCPALFRSGEPKQGDGADLTALPAVPSPAAPDHERDQFLAWLKSENERRLPFWWRK